MYQLFFTVTVHQRTVDRLKKMTLTLYKTGQNTAKSFSYWLLYNLLFFLLLLSTYRLGPSTQCYQYLRKLWTSLPAMRKLTEF